jgi:hypothetical protein
MSRDGNVSMRLLLIILTVAGLVMAVTGAATATGWVILVGLSALAVAGVMAALALPSTRTCIASGGSAEPSHAADGRSAACQV